MTVDHDLPCRGCIGNCPAHPMDECLSGGLDEHGEWQEPEYFACDWYSQPMSPDLHPRCQASIDAYMADVAAENRLYEGIDR